MHVKFGVFVYKIKILINAITSSIASYNIYADISLTLKNILI